MQELTLDRFPRKVLARITVERAFIVSRLVVAAERLQLFRLLNARRMKSDAIGRALDIHPAYLAGFLDSLVSIGLLRKNGEIYSNSHLARKYLLDERPIYWTRQFSRECAEAYDAMTVLEQALASGKNCKSIKGMDKVSYTEAMRNDPQRAENFTQMLFHYHRDDAEALAGHLNLAGRGSLLDVGGGSGVMSIALVRKNPDLRACILDIAPVCVIAAGNIRRAGFSRRIATLAGDINQPLPTGHDAIMFCDIGPISKERLRHAYEALAAKGLVILVDRFLSRDRTQPLDRVVGQFISSSFPVATSRDMVESLRDCGFSSVRARIIRDDLWCITGVKCHA